ncbi:MAG: hypothetical protein M3Y59_07950 [Myxococcota bacterium]|nr:hypothetical protein [Myxococcota bacterium]
MKLSRKEFLLGTMGAVVVGGLAAPGCGGGNGNPDAGQDAGNEASCLDNGTAAAIPSNHGHTLNVSKEDVAAGVEKIYDITGSATHAHSVTVTAANFTTLAGNTQVVLQSSTGLSHSHSVTVTCV